MDIEVTKETGFIILLPLDEDGTPLANGERMVEVSPGIWKSRALIEVEEYLQERIPLGED